jgi:hypothetical protein
MSMMMILQTPLAAALLAGLVSAPTVVNAGNATQIGFRITITDVSKDGTLKIPDGSIVRAPVMRVEGSGLSSATPWSTAASVPADVPNGNL